MHPLILLLMMVPVHWDTPWTATTISNLADFPWIFHGPRKEIFTAGSCCNGLFFGLMQSCRILLSFFCLVWFVDGKFTNQTKPNLKWFDLV
jgi:hypothetical protein